MPEFQETKALALKLIEASDESISTGALIRAGCHNKYLVEALNALREDGKISADTNNPQITKYTAGEELHNARYVSGAFAISGSQKDYPAEAMFAKGLKA